MAKLKFLSAGGIATFQVSVNAVTVMHLSMYCPTLPLLGEVVAKYGALTAKVHPHIGDIVISVFVKYTMNIRSHADHKGSTFLLYTCTLT